MTSDDRRGGADVVHERTAGGGHDRSGLSVHANASGRHIMTWNGIETSGGSPFGAWNERPPVGGGHCRT